jgi:hypothetical protein
MCGRRLEEHSMKYRYNLRLLFLGLAATSSLIAQIQAREVIRSAVAADERNWQITRNYSFLQRVELRRLDGEGKVKSAAVQTYDVTLQGGTPYRQLVQRDDRPLLANEEKKERENLAKSIVERRQETGGERAKRLLVYEKRPDWRRAVWHELPDAFDFRTVGEEVLDGRRLLVIDAVAHTGYQPQSATAKLFRSLRGTFWVDQQNHQIVKVEAEVTDAIWIGLFLVRVATGSRATLNLTSVGEGVWLPDRLQIFASARLGLLQGQRVEQSVSFSQYRSVAPAVPKVQY